ncbi:hypothetical protein WICPIJ_003203 [Wickerhamomyces pijperi]|uniref:Copper-fist domain-containing protein n=1 Tax=Wickerhamomyces pijperi TaxID=599730 RepID=A0A9P8QA95_WICPI|nr:hypothetical protein WICPIJ_003203 [Wickerhamomyces pijperi]
MILSDHLRFSCSSCVKGHRQPTCAHFDKIKQGKVFIVQDTGRGKKARAPRGAASEGDWQEVRLLHAELIQDSSLNPKCSVSNDFAFRCGLKDCWACKGKKVSNVFVKTQGIVVGGSDANPGDYEKLRDVDTFASLSAYFPFSVQDLVHCGLTYTGVLKPYDKKGLLVSAVIGYAASKMSAKRGGSVYLSNKTHMNPFFCGTTCNAILNRFLCLMIDLHGKLEVSYEPNVGAWIELLIRSQDHMLWTNEEVLCSTADDTEVTSKYVEELDVWFRKVQSFGAALHMDPNIDLYALLETFSLQVVRGFKLELEQNLQLKSPWINAKTSQSGSVYGSEFSSMPSSRASTKVPLGLPVRNKLEAGSPEDSVSIEGDHKTAAKNDEYSGDGNHKRRKFETHSRHSCPPSFISTADRSLAEVAVEVHDKDLLGSPLRSLTKVPLAFFKPTPLSTHPESDMTLKSSLVLPPPAIPLDMSPLDYRNGWPIEEGTSVRGRSKSAVTGAFSTLFGDEHTPESSTTQTAKPQEEEGGQESVKKPTEVAQLTHIDPSYFYLGSGTDLDQSQKDGDSADEISVKTEDDLPLSKITALKQEPRDP